MKIRDLVKKYNTYTITTVVDSKKSAFADIFSGFLMEIETEETELLDVDVINYEYDDNYLTILV